MIKGSGRSESLAIIDYSDAQDTVAEEVNRSHARLQSAAVRVVQADRALRTGIITFNGTIEGLKQTSRFADVLVLISRPQEAVYALQLLQVAFDEYFTTVAEYNRAQFELFHALGYPARGGRGSARPGEVLPVDTGAATLPAPGGQRPAATDDHVDLSRHGHPSRGWRDACDRAREPWTAPARSRLRRIDRKRPAWPSMLIAAATAAARPLPGPCAAQAPAARDRESRPPRPAPSAAGRRCRRRSPPTSSGS